MSKLNERNCCIERLIESAQDCGAVGALVVCGDDATESGDLRVVAVPADSSGIAIAYSRLNYIVASELEINSSSVISRGPDHCAKRFELADGTELTLTVSDTVPTDGWYRIVWDEMNLSARLGDSVPEDILCDLAQQPEKPVDDFDDGFDDVLDDLPEDAPAAETSAIDDTPVADAADMEPMPEDESEAPAQKNEDELEKYLEFVSRNLRNAQRAIAAGQLIRAGEIVSVLRKMAIELICVRNGIDSNFEQSIDFIDCEEKHMLAKTYPRNMDQKNMVVALGTLSELFDRLI